MAHPRRRSREDEESRGPCRRAAAEAIGTSKSDAYRLRRRLEADEVIVAVVRGVPSPTVRRAMEWRFVGDAVGGAIIRVAD